MNDQLEWKGKKSDKWVMLGIVVLTIVVFHMVLSFPSARRRHRYNETWTENVQSPMYMFFSVVIILIFGSPVWAFRRRVPKRINLNKESRQITVVSRRKKKTITVDLEAISYNLVEDSLYTVLEFYYHFETARGVQITKLLRTVLVPNVGMGIDRKALREIVRELDQLNVPCQPNTTIRTFWEYLGE
jgi:hypothetical protein